MEFIDEVIAYLREENTDDVQAEVRPLIAGAYAYLKRSGPKVPETDEEYKTCVKILVNHWYENREPVGNTQYLAFGLQSMITQLQYADEEAEGESGGA